MSKWTLRVSHGLNEDGVIIGNVYDKYGTRNPIARMVMRGFGRALSGLVEMAAPESIHDVGCGEGFWVLQWNRQGKLARGSDSSCHVIELARSNARALRMSKQLFSIRSIYELEQDRDSADLVVCCEVLEHLESPEEGLRALQRIVGRHLIVSVPREPIWRILNLARGRYVTRWGNTPGHIQHWSKGAIIELVSRYFKIVDMRCPLPWVMIMCRRRVGGGVACHRP